ncbi:DUF3078 domain-containing protein [Membranicola marinus]|uniref:DUF3078 domain-containing protein n=1 Tax=Membranihabitans marinus TaxID=1227546 RepID=A0A953HPC1_9BACT|nr:DUF3078 domain-containing protein [Membranihabitans marinus]MBY5959724.1 DUF3078 domain-containing protein [Membranihabitans marinus]
MKLRTLLLATFIFFTFQTVSSAQANNAKRLDAVKKASAIKADTTGWIQGGGIGMDIGQLAFLNPKLGSGENRFGFGGAISYFANLIEDRYYWSNSFSLNLALQKLGSGVIRANSDEKTPFQKSIDELRINSKFGYAISKESNFNYAVDFSFLSQFTPTYNSKVDGGNYLKNIEELETSLASKIFNPATVIFGVGIDYKPTPTWSIYLSPVSYKGLIVADDDIAALGIHGNPWNSPTDFENTDNQIGGLLKIGYSGNLVPERISYNTSLGMYSNYLNNPQNIDIDWVNEFAFKIYKGLQLSVLVNLFYDDDVLVQISDSDAVGGIKRDPDGNVITGKRVSITEQMLLKYIYVF